MFYEVWRLYWLSLQTTRTHNSIGLKHIECGLQSRRPFIIARRVINRIVGQSCKNTHHLTYKYLSTDRVCICFVEPVQTEKRNCITHVLKPNLLLVCMVAYFENRQSVISFLETTNLSYLQECLKNFFFQFTVKPIIILLFLI